MTAEPRGPMVAIVSYYKTPQSAEVSQSAADLLRDTAFSTA